MKVPNATTRKAIAELETGKGKSFTSVDALMADLKNVSKSSHPRDDGPLTDLKGMFGKSTKSASIEAMNSVIAACGALAR